MRAFAFPLSAPLLVAAAISTPAAAQDLVCGQLHPGREVPLPALSISPGGDRLYAGWQADGSVLHRGHLAAHALQSNADLPGYGAVLPGRLWEAGSSLSSRPVSSGESNPTSVASNRPRIGYTRPRGEAFLDAPLAFDHSALSAGSALVDLLVDLDEDGGACGDLVTDHDGDCDVDVDDAARLIDFVRGLPSVPVGEDAFPRGPWRLGSLGQSLAVEAPAELSSITTSGHYGNYGKRLQDRPTVAYLASNAGVLHAFDADDAALAGVERWFYVPGSQLDWSAANAEPQDGRIRSLMDSGEVPVHGGRIVLDHVWLDGYSNGLQGDSPLIDCPSAGWVADWQDGKPDAAGCEWHRVVVWAGGVGSRHVHALDVTNPDAPRFLFERSGPAGTDGRAVGTPAVGTFLDDSDGGEYRWLAVWLNGSGDPGVPGLGDDDDDDDDDDGDDDDEGGLPFIDDDPSDGKLDICHKRNNGTFRVNNLSINAVQAHLNHGDHMPLYTWPDADGFGDSAGEVDVCRQPGTVDNDLDCDDTDPTVHPGGDPEEGGGGCDGGGDGDGDGDDDDDDDGPGPAGLVGPAPDGSLHIHDLDTGAPRVPTEYPAGGFALPTPGGAYDAGELGAVGGVALADLDGDGAVDVGYFGDSTSTIYKVLFDPTAPDQPEVCAFASGSSADDLRVVQRAPAVVYDDSGRLLVVWGSGTDLEIHPDRKGGLYVRLDPAPWGCELSDPPPCASGANPFDGEGFLGFESAGEYLAAAPVVRHGKALFTTQSLAEGTCSPGVGRLYAVDLSTCSPGWPEPDADELPPPPGFARSYDGGVSRPVLAHGRAYVAVDGGSGPDAGTVAAVPILSRSPDDLTLSGYFEQQ